MPEAPDWDGENPDWADEGWGEGGQAQAVADEDDGGEDQREAGTGGQAGVGPQQPQHFNISRRVHSLPF